MRYSFHFKKKMVLLSLQKPKQSNSYYNGNPEFAYERIQKRQTNIPGIIVCASCMSTCDLININVGFKAICQQLKYMSCLIT